MLFKKIIHKTQMNFRLDPAVALFVIIWHSWHPHWRAWYKSKWECIHCFFVRYAGQGPENISSVLFFFWFILFIWHDTGSPGTLWGDILNISPGEMEGISDFVLSLAFIPLCFATFLYYHVFLYINILKFFCHPLFIKVIF